MDVNTIQTAISTLGFPIVCVLFLGWFIWKIWMLEPSEFGFGVKRMAKKVDKAATATVPKERPKGSQKRFLFLGSDFFSVK